MQEWKLKNIWKTILFLERFDVYVVIIFLFLHKNQISLLLQKKKNATKNKTLTKELSMRDKRDINIYIKTERLEVYETYSSFQVNFKRSETKLNFRNTT